MRILYEGIESNGKWRISIIESAGEIFVRKVQEKGTIHWGFIVYPNIDISADVLECEFLDKCKGI